MRLLVLAEREIKVRIRFRERLYRGSDNGFCFGFVGLANGFGFRK